MEAEEEEVREDAGAFGVGVVSVREKSEAVRVGCMGSGIICSSPLQ
jgi:hypothetical protein